ncbi:MAG: hypothetical protein LBV20_03410 [Treponema sp.]|jgi:hypothetical protein|nr:hypothetical protein [Treponema sp.]
MKKAKYVLASLCVLSVFLLASCFNMLNPPLQKTGNVTISISDDTGNENADKGLVRTILPSTSSVDYDRFVLTFSPQFASASEFTETAAPGETISADLASGEWIITAQGFIDGDPDPIAEGSTPITASETSQSLTIGISAIMNESKTGTLRLTGLPPIEYITSATLTLIKDPYTSKEGQPESFGLSDIASFAEGRQILAGYYSININAEVMGEAEAFVFEDIVHIYPHYTSTINVGGDAPPVGPIVVPSTDGRLTISGLEDFNGKYVIAQSQSGTLLAVEDVVDIDVSQNTGTYVGGLVSNGSVTLNVWEIFVNGANVEFLSYNGNDKDIPFQVRIYENEILQDLNAFFAALVATANFTNGIGSAEELSDPTTMTINDLPSEFNGKEISAALFQNIGDGMAEATAGSVVSNGSVHLWFMASFNAPWIGQGPYFVQLTVPDENGEVAAMYVYTGGSPIDYTSEETVFASFIPYNVTPDNIVSFDLFQEVILPDIPEPPITNSYKVTISGLDSFSGDDIFDIYIYENIDDALNESVGAIAGSIDNASVNNGSITFSLDNYFSPNVSLPGSYIVVLDRLHDYDSEHDEYFLSTYVYTNGQSFDQLGGDPTRIPLFYLSGDDTIDFTQFLDVTDFSSGGGGTGPGDDDGYGGGDSPTPEGRLFQFFSAKK